MLQHRMLRRLSNAVTSAATSAVERLDLAVILEVCLKARALAFAARLRRLLGFGLARLRLILVLLFRVGVFGFLLKLVLCVVVRELLCPDVPVGSGLFCAVCTTNRTWLVLRLPR